MTEIGKEKESTRTMKHALIHELLKRGLKVYEPVGMREGSNLIVGDFIGDSFSCVVAQVETASLGADYVFNIAARNDFRCNSKFFYLICLQNLNDEYRPTFLIIPTPNLKTLIENKLKTTESWKDDKPYGCHLSPVQLKQGNWNQFIDRFDLIFKAIEAKPTAELKREIITCIHFEDKSEKQTLLDWLERAQVSFPTETAQSIIDRIKASLMEA